MFLIRQGGGENAVQHIAEAATVGAFLYNGGRGGGLGAGWRVGGMSWWNWGFVGWSKYRTLVREKDELIAD